MSVGKLEEPLPLHSEEAEVARLAKALGEAQAQIEEQAAYYRAELEATRQRIENQNLRLQADEVAKRRRAEEQVLALKADLRLAQEETARARRRYDELARQLMELEESSRRQTQQEVGKVRAAAKAAWRGAEEELAQIERELAATRKLLTRERERCKQLEETVSQLRSQPQSGEHDDAAYQRLVSSLKKALWATAEARRRAESELATLKAAPAAHGDGVRSVYRAFQRPEAGDGFDGAYRIVSSEEWKRIIVGEPDTDLADEFLLMPSDASLDDATFAKLQSLPEAPEKKPTASVAEPPSERRKEVAQDSSRVVWIPPEDMVVPETPATSEAPPSELRRVLALLAIGGGVSGLAYWLLTSGLL